jgi:hypothetical protein
VGDRAEYGRLYSRDQRQGLHRSPPASRQRRANRTDDATLTQVLEALRTAGTAGLTATQLRGRQRKTIVAALETFGLVDVEKPRGKGRSPNVYRLTPAGQVVAAPTVDNLEPVRHVLADVLYLAAARGSARPDPGHHPADTQD